MKHKSKPKYILVVDRQEYWRELSAHALSRAGFEVQVIEEYTLPPEVELPVEPDLVVLGCASISRDEQALIGQVLDRKYHLLVLCTSLPLQVMRQVFLAGVDDVGDKPYDPVHLVRNVEQALSSISAHADGGVVQSRGTL